MPLIAKIFQILILTTLLAVSSAYLNHGPTLLNHPNYGPYHGGYSVTDPGLGAYQSNYLAQYRPHYPTAYPGHPGPVPVQIPAPVPVIQKLGHTGYGYPPARPLHIQPAPIQHSVPIGLPQVHPNAYAHSGYNAGVQTNYAPSYVVAPSVSFSQNAPKQIAPAAPVSKVIRIPYAYPTLHKPQPIPHPIPHPAELNHGW